MSALTLRDCIVPDWPAPANVKAFITTRRGGVSAGAYASLNLGFATADDERAVRANRSRVMALVPQAPRWLKQVHGADVVEADDLTTRPDADAAVARRPATVCAILVADCLPVLFAERSGATVAAAHAGWRGLAAGVLDNTVARMCAHGVAPRHIVAYIGPGIGPGAFEVGDEVYEAFRARDAEAHHAFRRGAPGKWYADLFALARRALERSGVTQVFGGGMCTYSDPARFYSHRRDGSTGRMAAFIWREES